MAKERAKQEKAAKFEEKKAAKEARAKAAATPSKRKENKESAEVLPPYQEKTPKGEKKILESLEDAHRKAYIPSVVESAWYDWWEKEGFHEPQFTEDGNVKPRGHFVISEPPPNVTGALHCGHALATSLQDTMIRWNRMRGYTTLYLPGCDHAGISTQSVVENMLWRRQQKTRHDLGRPKFVETVQEWKEEYHQKINKVLRRMGGSELRDLGRLPYPMIRRKGEAGFTRVTWDRALEVISSRIRATSPDRLGFYLTSRGQPNETYFAAQKAVRAMGTNSIDNAARVCHSPSTFGLKGSLGVAATTCSYSDWIGSDLVVFIGSNVANNQPVSMKYLYKAKKAGTKVVVINSYREPGMDRYWVPSNLESALFGTKIADRFFLVNVGGDIGFLNGALKAMILRGWLDEDFIEQHVSGFNEVGGGSYSS